MSLEWKLASVIRSATFPLAVLSETFRGGWPMTEIDGGWAYNQVFLDGKFPIRADKMYNAFCKTDQDYKFGGECCTFRRPWPFLTVNFGTKP